MPTLNEFGEVIASPNWVIEAEGRLGFGRGQFGHFKFGHGFAAVWTALVEKYGGFGSVSFGRSLFGHFWDTRLTSHGVR